MKHQSTSLVSTLTALALLTIGSGVNAADEYSTQFAKNILDYRISTAATKDNVSTVDCKKTPLKPRKDTLTLDSMCVKAVHGPFDGPQGGHLNIVHHHGMANHEGRGYLFRWAATDHSAVPLASQSPKEALEQNGNPEKETIVVQDSKFSASFTRQFRYIETKSDKDLYCMYMTGQRGSNAHMLVMSCGKTQMSDDDFKNLKVALKALK